MALESGTALGSFEIVDLLGIGGMGEVYRARDTKLGREVAIKVLPEAVASDPERLARFEREARVLASLDHPNIGALHDFRKAVVSGGESLEEGDSPVSASPRLGQSLVSGEVHFLVMQLVEGETLAERLVRGPIPLDEALPIFIQIAEALAAAHEAGIVHRDLKPGNIKVTGNDSVKVLDFGLAKAAGSEEPADATPTPSSPDATTLPGTPTPPTSITGTEMIVGTPSYMSPEQARGRKVDKRSDVWAFGCCLYQSLTGRKPFEGDTIADTISSITRDTPDLDALPPGTAPDIRRLLGRCLEKNPKLRLSSMNDIALTLRAAEDFAGSNAEVSLDAGATERSAGMRWAIGMGAVVLGALLVANLFRGAAPSDDSAARPERVIQSLAVLPFDNLMGDESKEYFVDGMTDTLTAELSKIGSIKVIARTSAMKFKNSDKRLSEIASELGVEGLIEGSVQQFEDQVRITAQLIDGQSEAHLWGENFEGTVAGVMKLQGEVAVSIAEQIGAVLTPEEREEYVTAKDVNPEAYDLYLRGRSVMQSRLEKDLRRAIELFEQAISIDPEFALPQSGLSDVYGILPLYSGATNDEVKDKAFAHARKAIELDGSLADGYASLGWAYSRFDVDRNWEAGLRAHERAIELNPGLSRARRWYSVLLTIVGRSADSVRQSRVAYELDPLDPLVLMNLGMALSYAGSYDDAEEILLRGVEMDPSLSATYMQLRMLYERTGRLEEALDAARNAHAIAGFDDSEWFVIVLEAAVEGIEALRTLVDEVARGEHDAKVTGASAAPFAAMDDIATALAYLGRDIQSGRTSAMLARNLAFPGFFDADTQRWRYLHEDPRFWAMLDQYNLPPLPPDNPRYKFEQAYLRQKAAEAALAAQPKPVRRMRIRLAEGDQFAGNGRVGSTIALSPDGERLFYVSENALMEAAPGIYTRRLDEFEYTVLEGTKGGRNPFLSPDGRWLGFYSHTDRKLLRIPISGGPPLTICDASIVRGAVWLPDGSIVFSAASPSAAKPTENRLMRVSSAGGTPADLTVPDEAKGETDHDWPLLLPGGKRILFSVRYGDDAEDDRVAMLDLETKAYRVLDVPGTRPAYTPSGHIVVGYGDDLFAVPFDLERQVTRGALTPAIRDVEHATRLSGRVDYAFTDTGTLVYAPTGTAGSRQKYRLVWVSPDGSSEPDPAPVQTYHGMRVSPDGNRVAVTIPDDLGSAIWMYSLERRLFTRLTFDGDNSAPIWLPSGEEILYRSVSRDPASGLGRLRADGGGLPESIASPLENATPVDVTADGRYVVAVNTSAGRGDVVLLDITGEEAPRDLLKSPRDELEGRLSPDGHWLAHASDLSGAYQVYVTRFDGPGRWQVSADGGFLPIWSPDGARIYFSKRGEIWVVDVETEPTFRAGIPRKFFDGVGFGPGQDFDVAPDGRLLVRVYADDDDAAVRDSFLVVENWFEELKRLAPVREGSR